MEYFSTRGDSRLVSFEQAVLTGLAPDSGLYIPTRIPPLPSDWRTAWQDLSFVELAVAVLRLYISSHELSKEELRGLLTKSFRTFRHEAVAPLRKLAGSHRQELYIVELFHGPTFAFKDVALQFLGNLFEFFLKRRNAKAIKGEARERLTVIGATSGDTGSAAIYGLRNKSDISIFILHPKGRVSPIQEAQMTTVLDANVHNIAVKGTFDDCQDIVKSLFADCAFNEKYRLGAVNSINWARILAQTVYYFSAYFQIQSQLPVNTPIDSVVIQFVVPTGNFGDVLAGYYAKRMGLPMDKLVVATNENDILARFWKTGTYEKGAYGLAESGVKATFSPAMDILVSSNFERLLWYLAHETIPTGDERERREAAGRIVAGWMGRMKVNGRVELPIEVLTSARKDFTADSTSDEETLKTIQETFTGSESYVVDPHTAVALHVAHTIARSSAPNTQQIVLSTAHPAKFSEAVTHALGGLANFDFARDVLPEEFSGLLDREKRIIDVDYPEVRLVKAVIERTIGV